MRGYFKDSLITGKKQNKFNNQNMNINKLLHLSLELKNTLNILTLFNYIPCRVKYGYYFEIQRFPFFLTNLFQ